MGFEEEEGGIGLPVRSEEEASGKDIGGDCCSGDVRER